MMERNKKDKKLKRGITAFKIVTVIIGLFFISLAVLTVILGGIKILVGQKCQKLAGDLSGKDLSRWSIILGASVIGVTATSLYTMLFLRMGKGTSDRKKWLVTITMILCGVLCFVQRIRYIWFPPPIQQLFCLDDDDDDDDYWTGMMLSISLNCMVPPALAYFVLLTGLDLICIGTGVALTAPNEPLGSTENIGMDTTIVADD